MEDFVFVIFKNIALKLNILTDNLSSHSLLTEINRYHLDLGKSCSEFQIAWEALQFAKKDMQLYLKAPDLFTTQKKMLQSLFQQKLDLLIEKSLKYNIDIQTIINNTNDDSKIQ